jgi:hypothetical protein
VVKQVGPELLPSRNGRDPEGPALRWSRCSTARGMPSRVPLRQNANDEMPVHQHAGVLLLLGQAQDLVADPGALVELGLGDVVAGQAPEHWEQWRQFASLEWLEGGRVRLFDLARIPTVAHRHDPFAADHCRTE